MPENYWGDFLVAYRRHHNVTQSELAGRLGVSPPTVSRWESGVHIPDPVSQRALKLKLGALITNTESEWIFRVEASHGVEFLISRGRGVVASSARARGDHPLLSYLNGIFILAPAAWEAAAPRSAEETLRTGLFGGALRLAHFVMEMTVDGNRVDQIVDLWPLLTVEHSMLVHAVSSPSSGDSAQTGAADCAVRDMRLVER